MKIVHLSTYDSSGGAAKAARLIHNALLQNGHDSKMLVLDRKTIDPTIISFSTTKLGQFLARYIGIIDHLPRILLFRKPEAVFTFAWRTFFDFKQNKLLAACDVICLYWVGNGFLSPKAIMQLFSFNKPVIWRLSDLWPFTGGCHYPYACTRFVEKCYDCHLLKNSFPVDFAKRQFNQKLKYWGNLKFNVLCPSQWIEKLARQSALLKHCTFKYIPTGIDTKTFHPDEKEKIPKSWQFPLNRKIILFGASQANSNKIKGIDFFSESLEYLDKICSEKFIVVIFGDDANKKSSHRIETYYTGYIHDKKILAGLYACADVFICPSKEENLANTVLESMSCGTPVVAFNIGGMPDVIEHQINGYLAEPFKTDDLAEGIKWVLSNPNTLHLRKMARKKIEDEFDIVKTTRHFQSWLETLIQTN